MLILTRKPNESVIIDNKVTLKIIEVRGNQVRIGIEAPAHISIHREEVQKRIAEPPIREALSMIVGNQNG
jgi:carbon storage regulator